MTGARPGAAQRDVARCQLRAQVLLQRRRDRAVGGLDLGRQLDERSAPLRTGRLRGGDAPGTADRDRRDDTDRPARDVPQGAPSQA